MSSEIDQRIVEMQFDNKQFERGVKETTKSLESLKKSLDLKSSAESLANLSTEGKRFSLGNISNSVEAIAEKFTTLGIIGVTALQNITNSAINAGKQIAKSLTIDPVMTGFNEYETKMNAITTILTNTKSKGTTLEDVNAALGELNTYADKTIYNFAEMTKNIGTFTAAGVDLDTSVSSIKGIANLAAGSGSSALQASTAMYQLSQAIASGSVKLQDWNSVVNAGMGGELFQNALKETAKELGVFVDESIPFRESLHDGWLTTEVLTKTLNKFAEDESLIKAATQVKTFTQLFDTMKESVQSGWAVSWEYIIGDSEQAATLLTNISDGFNSLIGASTDARNAMLKFWNENGGRDAVIEGLSNAVSSLGSVLKSIGEAWNNVFPPMTGEKLVEISNKFKEFTQAFSVSGETASRIKNTFQGLFSVLNIVKNAVISLVSAAGKVLGAFAPAGEGVLSFTSAIGNLLTKLNEAIDRTGFFKTIFDGLASGITFVAGIITKALDGIANGFGKMTENVDFSWFSAFAKIAVTISDAFKKMGKIVKNAMSNLGFDSVLDVVNGGLLAAILLGVKKFIGGLTEVVKSGNLLESLTDLLDGVKGSLEAWQNNLKANTLLKIGGAIALLSASLLVLSTIDPIRLTSSLGAITGLFIELFASMAIFDKIANSGFESIGKVTRAMIGLSAAVLVLSAAMKNLASLQWDEIAKGLIAVGVLMGELVAVSLILDKNSAKMVKGSAGLVLFSSALVILSQAVKQLSVISVEGLTKGLVGAGVLMAELALFMNTTDLNGMGLLKGAGILLLAESLKVLSGAVGILGNMDLADLAKGLGSVAVVLAGLDLFINTTGNASKTLSTAAAMTILAGAVTILANATKTFSDMSLDEIGRGLLAMAGALAVVTLAMHALPKNMVSQSAALVGIASSLIILSSALDKMGTMTWEEIARGLTVLAGSLITIAGAMKLMTGALPGAAALLVISASLLTLTPALIALGGMSWESIVKGLTMLAGVFAVLGVAALALTPVVPALIGLAGAIALFGAGTLAAGAGFLALGTGLTALAAAFAASGGAIYSVIENLLSVIPMIFQKIGEGIIELAGIIANGGPTILSAFVTLLSCAVDAIIEVTPKIVEGIFTLLDTLLQSLVTYVPKFADYLFQLFIEIINVLAERMPELISAGANLLMSFVNGVLDALGQIDGESLQGLIITIGSLITIFTLIGALAAVMTAASVAIAAMTGVLAILGGMSQIPGLTWLVNEGAAFLGAIGTAIGSFVGGLVGGFAEIASGALPGIGANLSAFMNAAKPFFEGVKGVDESASKGVAALASAILSLTASNILEGLTSWLTGGSSLITFGQELAGFAPYFKQYADTVSGISGDTVQASANAALALAEMAGKLPNSGGVAGWLTGENSLSAFAKELAEFGPVLMQYAESVSGLDSAVVENSVNAALAVSEFAGKLPNQGGVFSWFTGENTLSVFANELAEFGPKLKAYADSVSGMDGNVVINSANAALALSELANNLPNQGGLVSWFTGDNDIETFGQKLVIFGQGLRSYADTVSGINISQLNSVIGSVQELINIANGTQNIDFGGMAAFGNSLTKLGNTGIDGFISAFKNAIPRIKNVGVTVVTSVESGIASKKSSFAAAGRDAAQGFINGINSKLSSATAAGRRIGLAALEAAKKALDSHSPSKEFIYLGQAIGDGLAIGIDNSIGPVENATSNMIDEIITMSSKSFEEFEDWMSDKKYYNEISLSEELMAWEKIQQKYIEGSEERKKADREVYRVQNELVKATYQYSTDWIDEQKYYNKISLEEELAAWERIQSRYMEGSEERKKADKEVYRIKNELADESYEHSLNWIETEKEAGRLSLEEEISAYERIKARYTEADEEYTESVKAQTQARIDAKRAEYEHSMDWIEEEKYYNRLSLTDELAAYTRVQQRYEKGTEERKEMDREVYRLQNEINDAYTEYLDDIEQIEEDRKNKRIELEQEYADKTKEINDKLAEDIKKLDEEYASALESRTQTLYKSYGLFDEVTKKDEVSAETLMQNLRDQVDEFSDWRSQLDSLSSRGLNDALIDELEEMGPSAIAEIKALNSMSDSQLAQYATLWSEKHREAKEQATEELEGLRIETQSQIESLKKQAEIDLDGVEAAFHQSMRDLNDDTERQLVELKENFDKQVGIVRDNTEEELKTMTSNVKIIMQQAGWDELGQEIVNGMSSGIQNKQPSFIERITNLATAAVSAVKNILGIRSPSKVFTEIGKQMDEGMIIGLERYKNKVGTTSSLVGRKAVNSISDAISGISKGFDDIIDSDPIIRPVLDFSDLVKGFQYIDGAISANRSMNLGLYASYGNQNNNNPVEQLASKLSDLNAKSNGKIVEAIEELKNDFAGLVDKVTRLQVVMDTGSLVGAITPEMDRSLGEQMTLNRRGIR